MPKADQNPIGAAMDWVAKIVAAALMMVLPGLGGQWLDRKLGTGIFTLPGFLLGLVGGMWYLLAITAGKRPLAPASGKRRQIKERPENEPANHGIDKPSIPGQDVTEDANN